MSAERCGIADAAENEPSKAFDNVAKYNAVGSLTSSVQVLPRTSVSIEPLAEPGDVGADGRVWAGT